MDRQEPIGCYVRDTILPHSGRQREITNNKDHPNDHLQWRARLGIICQRQLAAVPSWSARDYRIQKRQRIPLGLDRHAFDVLFSVLDPSTATEMLMTAITEKLDEHCPMRSIKVSSKDHLI